MERTLLSLMGGWIQAGGTVFVFLVLPLIFAGCHWAPSEQMNVERQVLLSPEANKVSAYSISRAPGGDFFVAGSANSVDGEAWAARVNSAGGVRWEFRYRPFDTAVDHLEPDDTPLGRRKRESRFYNVVALKDDSILLCGIKSVRKRPTPFLIFLDHDGKFTEERTLQTKEDGYPTGLRCLKWGDGAAVLGVLARAPKGIGWLVKLDSNGSVLWEKADDLYGYDDAVEMADHSLMLIGGYDRSIVNVDGTGVVLGHYSIPGSDQHIMHPMSPQSHVRVGVVVSTTTSEFLTFNLDLKGPTRSVRAAAVGIKEGYELADGSLIVFGSTYRSTATANIARVYDNSTSTNFPVQPPYESPWIDDAVPGNEPNQFVAVRQVSGNSVIAWVAVKRN
jgi:hypothetical protein